jgi:hypothetical protein
MSKLPPPVTESRFEEVEGVTKEQIRKRVTPFIGDLHSYLNRGSCLRNIQRTRRDRNPNIRSISAFARFAVAREHWYTYNVGGRSEAQFNIGLFPEYLQIGLGFEFTKKMHGNPRIAKSMYEQFVDVLRQDRESFDQFVHENSLQIEWRPGESRLEYEPTKDVSSWLIDSSDDAEWLFVGKLLRREDDAKLLEDPSLLKESMESVFMGFKPLWQQVQMQVKI